MSPFITKSVGARKKIKKGKRKDCIVLCCYVLYNGLYIVLYCAAILHFLLVGPYENERERGREGGGSEEP